MERNDMNLEMILGKEGEQPFPISNSGVSRKHACITVHDGVWTLEDLNSTNGTFIQDEDGEFERICKKQITEKTVIRLGPGTMNGYTFMAHRIVVKDSNDYSFEFLVLSQTLMELGEKEKMLKKKLKQHQQMRLLLPALALGLSYLPFVENLGNPAVMIRLVMFVPSLLSGFLFGKDPQEVQKLAVVKARLLVCPKCHRPLTQYELDNEICLACKAHS